MILETERLLLRKLTLEDAPFIFALVNSSNWLKFIGDKQVKTLKDAEAYIQEKMLDHYAKFGFGFYLVLQKKTHEPIGITGFIKRPSLEHVEVGFAFLPDFEGKGYAFESTHAAMGFGKNTLKIAPIVAITHPENTRSQKLLINIGLQFEGMIQPEGFKEECSYFIEVV